jgi:hypothetical protein
LQRVPLSPVDLIPTTTLFLNDPVLLTFSHRRHPVDDEGGNAEGGRLVLLSGCKNLACTNGATPRAYASLCPWTKFISGGGHIVTYANRFAYFGGTATGKRPLEPEEGGMLQLLIVDVLEGAVDCTTIQTIGVPPSTRFGHTATCVNQCAMFIFGGIDATGRRQQSLHILDYLTCVWREAYIPSSALVPAWAFHCAAWVPWSQSLVFAAGTAATYGDRSVKSRRRQLQSGSTWEYHVPSDTWTCVSFPLLKRTDRDTEMEFADSHRALSENSISTSSHTVCIGMPTQVSEGESNNMALPEARSVSSANAKASERSGSSAPTSPTWWPPGMTSASLVSPTAAGPLPAAPRFDAKEVVAALYTTTLPPCQQQETLSVSAAVKKGFKKLSPSQEPQQPQELQYTALVHGSQAAAVVFDDGVYLVGGVAAPMVLTVSRIGPSQKAAGSLKLLAAMWVLQHHALLTAPAAQLFPARGSSDSSARSSSGLLHKRIPLSYEAVLGDDQRHLSAIRLQQAREWLQQWRHAADGRRQIYEWCNATML